MQGLSARRDRTGRHELTRAADIINRPPGPRLSESGWGHERRFGRSVRIGRGFTAGWCAGSSQSADCHRHASPDLSAGSIGPGGLRGRMSCGRSRCALQETRHQNVVLGDSGPKSRFGRWFPHTETSPYVRNAAISRHFERDPIPYALETDWPLEVPVLYERVSVLAC